MQAAYSTYHSALKSLLTPSFQINLTNQYLKLNIRIPSIHRLLPQSLNGRTHGFTGPQCLHGLLVDLKSFLAKLDNLLGQRGGNNHHSVFIADEDILGVNPKVALELKGNVDF